MIWNVLIGWNYVVYGIIANRYEFGVCYSLHKVSSIRTYTSMAVPSTMQVAQLTMVSLIITYSTLAPRRCCRRLRHNRSNPQDCSMQMQPLTNPKVWWSVKIFSNLSNLTFISLVVTSPNALIIVAALKTVECECVHWKVPMVNRMSRRCAQCVNPDYHVSIREPAVGEQRHRELGAVDTTDFAYLRGKRERWVLRPFFDAVYIPSFTY